MGTRSGRRLVAFALALICLASVVVIAAPSAAAKTNWPNLIVSPDPLVAGQTATVAIAFVDVDSPSSEWIWGCPNDVTFTWQSADGQYFADTTYTIPADDNLNDGTASPSVEVPIPAGIPEGTTIAFGALSSCDHTEVMGPLA